MNSLIVEIGVARPIGFKKLGNTKQPCKFSHAKQMQQLSKHSTQTPVTTAATAQEEEEDLWQYPDRDQWYAARFCADDQPDWNVARFSRSTQIAPGIKEVVLDVEISRERIPLRNSYRHIGQRALIRVNGGVEIEARPACPPFPIELNTGPLNRVRGDLSANHIKQVVEMLSVITELPLLVTQDSAPDLYNLGMDEIVELGPFVGGGMDLRGPIAHIFLYTTIILFVETPEGLAAAKALVEASPGVGGLSPKLRQDVRMYYRAKNATEFCYKDLFEQWKEQYGVKVATSTRDTFQEMFDDDDTLMYDPNTTAAVILTGVDAEAEIGAIEACKEAEITVVVKQSEEQAMTEYLKSGKKDD